ncbi:MAG TPA: SBBP repeat-containing protein, partial [Bryobacteraceae bacterium]
MTKLLWIAGAVVALLALSGAAGTQLNVAPSKLLSLASLPVGPRSPAGATVGRPLVAEGYGKLPLAFEPNLGPTDARVRFIARGGGMTAFFTDTEAVMVLSRAERRDPKALPQERREPGKVEQAVVRMKLEGAMKPRQAVGLDKLPGISNYFIGNDPKKWRTDVPHYARVEYDGVYPGINLVWYGNQRQLEYDFVVAPGSDPKQIQVAYEGVESVGVAADGELVLRTALGEVRQQQPRVYQEVDGKRAAVGARYALLARNRVSFELAKYDRKRELRIDPVVLVYSTYLGGTGSDGGAAIAVDGAGAAYITGIAGSVDFPTQSPFQDAYGGGQDVFVAKLAPTGDALIYSTYLGGSGYDVGNAIAVDGAGSAYVTGITMSANFPVQSPYQASIQGDSNAFVTKLAPAGNALVYSTYLGGYRDSFGQGIAVDGVGSAYVTGQTGSGDFPTQSPYQASLKGYSSAFVTKLVPAGNALVYSTFLGGSGIDVGTGIAVDGTGAAYVTGNTSSTDFPVKFPVQDTYGGGNADAFVTKLTPAGNALVYSTYLGGSGFDQGFAIAVDGTGSAYVAGSTESPNFPVQEAYQSALRGPGNAFVTKLTPAGSLTYSTYLGGSGALGDGAGGIAVDAADSAYVTGTASSVDFPTKSAYQSTLRGVSSAFATKLAGYPGAFVLLSPAQGATGISINPTLSWDASPFATSYDLYFGTSSSPPIMTTTSGTSYALGALSPETTYYWQVVASDSSGSASSGIWSFTTAAPPAPPLLLLPANGATGVTTPVLSWNAASGATSYDVSFGTQAWPPLVTNTTGTNYSPGTLVASTTYYWQVVATNSVGSASSATWSFTTLVSAPPGPALVSPSNGAAGVSLTPTVNWNAATDATSYDVYFGTASPPPLATNTIGTSYSPGTLSPGTAYYWQVVAKNSGGSTSSGTWSFTTAAPAAGLLFVPVAPCRVADTRNSGGPFGGPTMTAGSTRSFAIPQSACSIPSTALEYSLNVTVVPAGPLGYLSLWPTGQTQPYVSTLNSPGGIVLANAALVPAGSGGAVSVYVSDETDVILDIDGYFATSTGTTSYSFYPAPPCRIADTRN